MLANVKYAVLASYELPLCPLVMQVNVCNIVDVGLDTFYHCTATENCDKLGSMLFGKTFRTINKNAKPTLFKIPSHWRYTDLAMHCSLHCIRFDIQSFAIFDDETAANDFVAKQCSDFMANMIRPTLQYYTALNIKD